MSTKTRRPVAMVTPPPQQSRQRSAYSASEKQSLLDNFDLEVADKTRAFKSTLEATLSSFSIRQETEMMKIPLALRKMTLEDLEAKWGVSWSAIVQRIAREKMEEREKAEAAAAAREHAEQEEAKLKRLAKLKVHDRKRAMETSPGRSAKNARRDVPGSAKKSKSTAKTPRQKVAAALNSNKPLSSLPQNHMFNPSLPPTPGYPRQARRHESFFSANGSPIVLDVGSPSSSTHPQTDDTGVESDDSDDLPDAQALEAKILATKTPTFKPSQSRSQPSRPAPPLSQFQSQSQRAPLSSSQGSMPKRGKRGPSLFFRQSMAPADLGKSPDDGDDDEAGNMTHIPLSDGRVITFDPLEMNPEALEAEIDKGGIAPKERDNVIRRIRDEACKALTAKMVSWKVV